jgi:hypothetical protein
VTAGLSEIFASLGGWQWQRRIENFFLTIIWLEHNYPARI